MKSTNQERTELLCLTCGNVSTIIRTRNLKKEGHIKDLYCYKCKETTKHYELRDTTRYLLKKLNQEILTDEELRVIELLLGKEQEYGEYNEENQTPIEEIYRKRNKRKH